MLRNLFYLVLVVLALGTSSIYAEQCPSVCTCLQSSVTCSNITAEEFGQIFHELGSGLIERFVVNKCATPLGRVDGFSKTFRARSLEISSCGVTGFGADAFKHMANDLIDLRLSNNSLTTMPFLQNLRKLETLNVNKNLLDTIPEGSFNGLEQLSQVRLKSNKICKLPSKALNEIKGSLELLDLSQNCLEAVPAQNLRSAIFLKHLDLSGNRIVNLKDLELMNLPALKEIRLSENKISQISMRAFVNVPMLTHLYLKHNELTTVDSTMLQNFKHLNVIDLSANHLQKIPSFKDMAELKLIYLQENNVTRIDTLTFASNPNLQVIALSNNKIDLIARNSFDSLGGLSHLLLGNNSLQTIEAGVLDGMPNLAVLSLRGNSINELTSSSFSSLPELTSLDLANNKLQRIPAGAFGTQRKLYWLDLSNNGVTSLEQGAFAGSIATILLHGNKLVCDSSLDWFITYLVKNNIRTFLPKQPEITCAGPPEFAGVRIKELMIKKANDTLATSMKQIGITNPQQRSNFLSNLLPALSGMGLATGGNAAAGGSAPVLGSLSQAIPSLRSIPGWNGIIPGTNTGDPASKNLESAVEQFAEPLVRFSAGGQPAASDVSSLIQSIPNLIVSLPGYGNVDISKVHPKLIEHVLNGGTIPGVPKESMDSVVKQIMQRVYAAAAKAQNKPIEPEIERTLPRNGLKPEKYLRPLNELPETFVSKVMQGEPLPYLTTAQTEVVKEHLT
ncbi:hypothetical protein M3Y97_01167600 [Aphelenchoides bicaudatus]|nr:hypothetical protein M3Y97_01167600 [Aphelenchoides bicaudatus]